MPDAATGDGGIGRCEGQAMELFIGKHPKEDEVANDGNVPRRQAGEVAVGGGCGRRPIPAPNAAAIPRWLRGSPKRIGMRFFACVSYLLILFRGVAGAVIRGRIGAVGH
jgi:hypothetical protein